MLNVVVHQRIARGVDVVRVRQTDALYRGMKAHYGVALNVDGRTLSSIGGHTFEQTPGTLHLKEPGQLHRDLRRAAPGTFQLVTFEAALVEQSRVALDHGLRGSLSTVQLDPHDDRVLPLRQLHAVALGAADRFTLDVAITEALAAFTSFLGAAPRSSARVRPAVYRARTFLLDHLADKVTLDDLADHARADKFHLCRDFSRELGMPPYTFLTRARIARACILLRRGGAPATVASLVGFCDQSQLHRHFVRLVGCTPGVYARPRRTMPVGVGP